MKDFSLCIPTRFEFGRGAESKAGELIKLFGGSKALVHYGGGSTVRSGLLARVLKALDDAGVAHVELGGVKPNPRDTLVREGIELVRRDGVDFILAVGGGSVIDSSKAIALGAKYGGDFWDFFDGKLIPDEVMPHGAILTIAAAGSESSNSCVITREATKEKRSTATQLNRPLFALMNPELTYTVDAYQTAAGATDIMAHVMERYFTNEPGVDVTDRLCEAVLMSVIKAAPVALRKPEDYEARAQLMWASTIAHNDTCGAGRVSDGASHKIEHELSGEYDVSHGAGLAVVFPAWMRYMLGQGKVDRLCQYAVRVYGVEYDFEHPERTALAGIERHEAFLRSIGMPLTLAELGIENCDIDKIAANVRRNKGSDKVGAFVELDTKAIKQILWQADQS